MSGLQRVRHAYGRLLHAFGLIAAVAIFAMLLLVTANVIGRYAFNAPITGAFEFTEALLVVIIMLGLALTQYHDGHIRVTILTRRLPPRWAHAARICALVAGTVFFAWCTYASWLFAWESWSFKEQEWGTVTFPLYPFKFVVCLGVILLSVQFLLDSAAAIASPPPVPGQRDPEHPA